MVECKPLKKSTVNTANPSLLVPYARYKFENVITWIIIQGVPPVRVRLSVGQSRLDVINLICFRVNVYGRYTLTAKTCRWQCAYATAATKWWKKLKSWCNRSWTLSYSKTDSAGPRSPQPKLSEYAHTHHKIVGTECSLRDYNFQKTV